VQLVAARRGRAIPLDISIASHSSMMREAQSEMAPHITKTHFSDPDVPIVPNVYPQFVTEPEKVKDCLIEQMTGAVRWHDGVEHMINSGVHRFVEIGPGEVLTNLMKRIDVHVEVENTDALFSFQTQ
jgi:[acyl-carrier-protein] S-malonyltransferase